MPTGTPRSPALAPSRSFPGHWVGSHPCLPEGACWGSPDPEGSPGGAVGFVPMQVEREQELHSRLHHRHIVHLHGHFADRSHVYLLLEYCSRRVSKHQHPKTEHPHAGASPGPKLASRSVPSPSPTSCGPGGG